jgi:vitellogenic carboxypeptidase-like protein
MKVSHTTLALLVLVVCVIVHAYDTKRPQRARDPYEHSGYLQVNDATGASLFYWFFEAQDNNGSAPVILWLQGGPGSSSIQIGLLNELGPFRLDSNLNLVDNPYTWNKDYHVLFIDQPVGTGYSFTGTGGYATTGQELARDLYTALTQFFKLYPAYSKNDFYVFGESYGGKYVPYIASHILQQGSVIPLKGIGIGNGISDPVLQVWTYADQAYNLGLIDDIQRMDVIKLQSTCAQLADAGQWNAATDARQAVIDYISNASGNPNFYDIRTYVQYDWSAASQFLNLTTTRKQLHVGNNTFHTNPAVAQALKSDMMMTVKPLFPLFLDKIRVLLYQGQFDLRDGVVSNEAWITTIPWSGRDGYYVAPRTVWTVNGTVAGYAKKHQTLTQVTVVGAGHMVPMNQPQSAQALVSNFIENKPLPWKN